jgi:hypothetical protein
MENNIGNTFEKIFKDGVLVRVHVGCWSGERELIPQDLGLKPEDVVEAFNLGKKSLFPEDIIAAFRKIENKGRNTVKRCAFNFLDADFVPRTKFAEVNQTLKELQREYYRLADEVCEPIRYEQIKQQMIPIYREAAEIAFDKLNPPVMEFGVNEDLEERNTHREELKAEFVGRFMENHIAQYPPAHTLRSKFYFEWMVFKTALPDMDLVDGDDLEAKENARKEAERQRNDQLGAFINDVVTSLRQETVKVCGEIATAIKSGKVIKSVTIERLRNFIDRFKSMNFVGDQTVEEQLNAVAREFLDIDPKVLAGDIDLQAELGKQLEIISEAASAITEADIGKVTGQYVRVVDWQ